jgi:hypothetical protein
VVRATGLLFLAGDELPINPVLDRLVTEDDRFAPR